MFVASFVALAIALGLLGVRQSIAAVPAPEATQNSDSIVEVFEEQGALNASPINLKEESLSKVSQVIERLDGITKNQLIKKDGYLGSRTAISEDGRQRMVFVWFKNQASMLDWYENQVEKEVLRPFFPDLVGKKPKMNGSLAPNQPVMLVATLSPDFYGKKQLRCVGISKASFEVFASAGPAVALGPTFAPAS
jgi:hypothetical protein